MSTEKDRKVLLTAETLETLGEEAVEAIEHLKLINHTIEFIPNPYKLDSNQKALSYYKVYKWLDDLFEINQGILDKLDHIASLLLVATDEDELMSLCEESDFISSELGAKQGIPKKDIYK